MQRRIHLKKRNIAKKVTEHFEYELENLKKLGNITIYGDNEIFIDGCLGIIEISDENLKICVGKRTVKISGNNFVVKDYTDKSITICGDIESLIFSK